MERGAAWTCDDCSGPCAGCQLERESQCYLVKCAAGCPRCYHPGCLEPGLDKRSKAPWRCRHCLAEAVAQQQQQQQQAGAGSGGEQQQQHQDAAGRKEKERAAGAATPTGARKRPSGVKDNRK